MDKQRILYIGETNTHNEYLKGNVPSHWFYGAIEMEKDGHDVIWCQENSNKLNDYKLIKKYHPDIIFIPNLNIHNHLVLLLLARFINIPIFAYLHREPQIKKGLKSKFYKFLLGGIKHIFFLSDKSMYETVKAGLISPKYCSVIEWGSDIYFYNQVKTSDNGYFISTGKENRDFDVLIEAFKQTGFPLRIFTVSRNYSSHYEYLIEKCRNIPNIDVTILRNSAANFPMMLSEMAAAKALVCPLRQDKLNYCVGLSTITDAEGLRKPLIITHNPYHDASRVAEIGISVTTLDEWIDAIQSIQKKNIGLECRFSMEGAYRNMKQIMNL